MKFTKSILGIFLLALLSSCAFHKGYLSSNAVIIDMNFSVLGVAKGTSETTQILGIGGLGKDALVFEAKNDLYNQAALEPGQGLTNITVDFKNQYYLLVSKQKVTVTAEVIDFNLDDNELLNNYGQFGRITGDSAYVRINGKYQSVAIRVLLPSGISIINPETAAEESVNYSACFWQVGSFSSKGKVYSVGENVEMKFSEIVSGFKYQYDMIGTLVGMNERFVLILNPETDSITSFPIPSK